MGNIRVFDPYALCKSCSLGFGSLANLKREAAENSQN